MLCTQTVYFKYFINIFFVSSIVDFAGDTASFLQLRCYASTTAGPISYQGWWRQTQRISSWLEEERMKRQYQNIEYVYMFVCDLSVLSISYKTRHPARLMTMGSFHVKSPNGFNPTIFYFDETLCTC